MSCANCGSLMVQLLRDNRPILHCSTCGSSFFEDNDINRISIETAQHLSADRSTSASFTYPQNKKCPKDGALMKIVINSEALPQSVRLFHCADCNGIFAEASELVKFKKAQHSKLDYFKTWEKPLPRLKSVLIIFVFALLTGSLYLSVQTIGKRSSYQSQASELIQKVKLYRTGYYTLISFTTKTAFKSDLILKNIETNEEKVIPIMKDLSKVHTTSLSGIDPNASYTYKVRLTDELGIKVETEEKNLEP